MPPEPNCVTRRYPAFFSGFEETKHPFTTQDDLWRIDWLRAVADHPKFQGFFKGTVGLNGRCCLTAKVDRRGLIVGWLAYPPDFLPDDYGGDRFGLFPPKRTVGERLARFFKKFYHRLAG